MLVGSAHHELVDDPAAVATDHPEGQRTDPLAHDDDRRHLGEAVAVARAVAKQQGLTDQQLDEIEDKVDRLLADDETAS